MLKLSVFRGFKRRGDLGGPCEGQTIVIERDKTYTSYE
jgi:hypothetical protein